MRSGSLLSLKSAHLLLHLLEGHGLHDLCPERAAFPTHTSGAVLTRRSSTFSVRLRSECTRDRVMLGASGFGYSPDCCHSMRCACSFLASRCVTQKHQPFPLARAHGGRCVPFRRLAPREGAPALPCVRAGRPRCLATRHCVRDARARSAARRPRGDATGKLRRVPCGLKLLVENVAL
jgi:hypothetical protein